MGLVTTLEEITGVNFDILAGRVTDLDTISIAKRMSWAAHQETTYVEDQAYCLMGLFCVNMPPLYSEESNAFLRLQEEIVKGIPDQSVFAWGESCTLRSSREGTPGQWWTSSPALFAEAPFVFAPARDIIPLVIEDFAFRLHRRPGDVLPLHCVFTPQGIRLQLLCVDLTTIPHIFDTFWAIRKKEPCNDCMRLGHAHVLGLLRCKDSSGSLIALPLCQPMLQEKDKSSMDIAVHKMCEGAWHYPFRVVRLTMEALTEMLVYVSPAAVEVSLRFRPHKGKKLDTTKVTFKSLYAKFSISRHLNLWPGDRTDGVAFHCSPVSLDELRTLGFTFSPLLCTRSEHEIIIVASLTSGVDTESQHTIRIQIIITYISRALVEDHQVCVKTYPVPIRGDNSDETPSHTMIPTKSLAQGSPLSSVAPQTNCQEVLGTAAAYPSMQDAMDALWNENEALQTQVADMSVQMADISLQLKQITASIGTCLILSSYI
ncbi:hypothetical protein TRAPUB_5281 [Trametes pubescens]|uniref:DUF8212 domain-containing protein n=1 Tax=Trametes pubescens TaxID=154538 RepID=A0A1M2V947_TRAPU|nr:hypothetical protein TRAPUB_5281 [Trametes pubescens]